MATLDAKRRASLPDSAFAYVDSKGNRRLPIHDEAHVRNALSRFNQVKYENEDARERTFRRLLKAAIEHGIAPIGFVTRRIAEARSEAPYLPSGPVTLMMTDIEGSTVLVQELGDGYATVLEAVRALIRERVGANSGYEVDSSGDELFAAFGQSGDALNAAIEIQRKMADMSWPGGRDVRVRIGLHSGSPALTDTGYVGLPVHVMARVSSAAHGAQILITRATQDEIGAAPPGVTFSSLGEFHLQGLTGLEELLQVAAPGLVADFPAPRVGANE